MVRYVCFLCHLKVVLTTLCDASLCMCCFCPLTCKPSQSVLLYTEIYANNANDNNRPVRFPTYKLNVLSSYVMSFRALNSNFRGKRNAPFIRNGLPVPSECELAFYFLPEKTANCYIIVSNSCKGVPDFMQWLLWTAFNEALREDEPSYH